MATLIKKTPSILGTSPYELGKLEDTTITLRTTVPATVEKFFAAFVTGICQVSQY